MFVEDLSSSASIAPPVSAAAAAAKSPREEFSHVLGKLNQAEMTPQQRARLGAEQLVSIALVQPMLKHMRESNHAAAPFGQNQAQQAFGGMMDAGFASGIVKSSNWGLVNRVAQRLLTRVSQNDENAGVTQPAPSAGAGSRWTIGRQDAAFARE